MMAVEKSDALANVEAEAMLCGALMYDNALIDGVADRLSHEHFADPLLGSVYSVIVREYSLGRPATPVTLKPYFADDPMMSEVGGVGFLARLTGTGLALTFGAKGYADQIAGLAQRRKLMGGLRETLAMASDPAETNESIVDLAETVISDTSLEKSGITELSGAQCLSRLIASFDEPKSGVECVTIGSVDKVLGPIRPKQLVIGAGRPGMGKTAMAISYSLGAAQNGHGVLFVSLEMSADELAERMAADLCFDGRSGVPYEDIRDGNLTAQQRISVSRAASMMDDMPIQIVDAGSLTIGRLNMMVRRYVRRFAARGHKLELVVVDYLQLVSPDTKGQTMYAAVSEVSRGLKAIAKTHGVGVMALAQLSRDAEKRPDKRPQLSDLRDSGQIEQDADAVLFLYRLEYYLNQNKPEETHPDYPQWKQSLADCQGKIDFICAKRRNGRTGSATGNFHGANQAVRG